MIIIIYDYYNMLQIHLINLICFVCLEIKDLVKNKILQSLQILLICSFLNIVNRSQPKAKYYVIYIVPLLYN